MIFKKVFICLNIILQRQIFENLFFHINYEFSLKNYIFLKVIDI